MKKLIFLFLIAGHFSFSQELKYDELSKMAKLKPTIWKDPKRYYTSYVSKNGIVYKIGDKIKLGTPVNNKTFGYVSLGTITEPGYPIDIKSANSETEIMNIYLYSTNNGNTAALITKGQFFDQRWFIFIENALESGEVKSSGMTSDEALAELERAKKKLDLELITRQEYDKIKADLAKYIK